jgi:hypothetical protein
MELEKIIAQLREDRARVDETIVALEKVLRTRAPRRGRPPFWLKPNNAPAAKKKEKVVQAAL